MRTHQVTRVRGRLAGALRASVVPVVAAGAVVVATASWPAVGALLHHASSPQRWLVDDGIDVVASTLALAALWAMAVRVLIGLSLAALAALPGATGRLGSRLARVVLPVLVQRVLAGTTGLGVLLSPVLAGAASPERGTQHAATGVASGAPANATINARSASLRLPAPTWPTDDPLPAPALPITAPSAAAAQLPGSVLSTSPGHATAPMPAATNSATSGDAGDAGNTDNVDNFARAHATVTVGPGDSLWRIAAEHLPAGTSPAGVAASWPRWYAANRVVIGTDPALIHPGQQLSVPNEGNPS